MGGGGGGGGGTHMPVTPDSKRPQPQSVSSYLYVSRRYACMYISMYMWLYCVDHELSQP